MAMAVFVGSGLGGVCRWLASEAVGRWVASARWAQAADRWAAAQGWSGFMGVTPWGTLAVNVAGCFVIGLLYGLAAGGTQMSAQTRALLTTGFCGGLTTFSTFSNETLGLLQGGHTLAGAGYAALSLALGVGAAWLGHAVAR